MSESASKLAASLTGEETSSNTTDNTLEEVEGQEVDEITEESTEEPESTEEETDELPDSVKEILKKNRAATRAAEARAVAAEKALAAKDGKTEESKEESSPADDKYKALFIQSAAKTALVEAGLSTGTDKLLKLIDLTSVDVDDSGKISGLDDQIADLKEDFKDLFAPKQVRKSTGNVDGSRRQTPTVPKSSAELLASRVTG